MSGGASAVNQRGAGISRLAPRAGVCVCDVAARAAPRSEAACGPRAASRFVTAALSPAFFFLFFLFYIEASFFHFRLETIDMEYEYWEIVEVIFVTFYLLFF